MTQLTKSSFVNRTIELIDIECAVINGDAFEFSEYIKRACVERLYKLLIIDQEDEEDEATRVGTLEVEEVLLNLLCMVHIVGSSYEELLDPEWYENKREAVLKAWPAFKQHLIDTYA